jgi:uncharacterized RDD family membrane protein YckC
MQLHCSACRRVLEFSGDAPSFCGYCGKPLDPPTQLESTGPYVEEATRLARDAAAGAVTAAPESVGGYRLVRRLGSGGMGTVYEAEEMASKRRVAVKLITPEFASSADAVQRFRQEGRLASMIAHPRCVFVLSADEEAGCPYIVMELMSGTTLQEVIDKQGPLPQAEAVAKILDVMEGLQEAHRLGVIHRDVKPSNCFVLADGRVKIGDFGLAKSLLSGGHLTKTGTFLGTLLYAPPEQIKGEAIDFRTDVYSVAATLYFLLTGRAPYQSSDAAATLARTVSEPAPPLRRVRPELSRSLERVVLRGLERQRERRWKDLEEFRAALLPFAPGRLAVAGLGARCGAFLIDFALFLPLGLLLSLLLLGDAERSSQTHLAAAGLPYLIYFLPWGVMEGLWGWSPGKWLLRLRVCTGQGCDPPGLVRACLRTALFFALVWLAPEVSFWLEIQAGYPGRGLMLSALWEVLGILLLIFPMRARTGYRGLHEILSGTRVVRLPWPETRILRRRHPDRLQQSFPRSASVPERVGPFPVRGTLRQTGKEAILLGEDPRLGRRIWIELTESGANQVTAARRDLGRPTRLRWLAGGAQDGQRWDAFLAPQGCPLAQLVASGGPLSWREARSLLLQLADELVAACADGTLPHPLTPDQVWVQPGGRIHLLDTPLSSEGEPNPGTPGTGANQALELLRQTAVLALEGRPQPAAAGPQPIRAPVPRQAVAFLDRLAGLRQPYQDVEQAQVDLIALQGQATEVTTALRSGHLVLQAAFLYPVLVLLLGVRFIFLDHALQDLSNDLVRTERAAGQATEGKQRRALLAELHRGRARLKALRQTLEWDLLARLILVEDYVKAGQVLNREGSDGGKGGAPEQSPVAPPETFSTARLAQRAILTLVGLVLLCVLWAFLFRGGLSFRLVGIALLRANGRPALRLQCAWRALLFWLPVTALLALSIWVDSAYPETAPLAFWLWCSALGVLLGYMVLALWFPRRSLHDWLAGTYLVPN